MLQYGIGVPKGSVAHNAKEAEEIAKGIRKLQDGQHGVANRR